MFLLKFLIHVFSQLLVLITTRKRSLGQGNVFTPMCHSVHRVRSPSGGSESRRSASGGVVLYPGGSTSRGSESGGVCIRGGGSVSRGVYIQGGLHPGGLSRLPPSDTMRYSQQAGGTHPTGMHSCYQCIAVLLVVSKNKCTLPGVLVIFLQWGLNSCINHKQIEQVSL